MARGVMQRPEPLAPSEINDVETRLMTCRSDRWSQMVHNNNGSESLMIFNVGRFQDKTPFFCSSGAPFQQTWMVATSKGRF